MRVLRQKKLEVGVKPPPSPACLGLTFINLGCTSVNYADNPLNNVRKTLRLEWSN